MILLTAAGFARGIKNAPIDLKVAASVYAGRLGQPRGQPLHVLPQKKIIDALPSAPGTISGSRVLIQCTRVKKDVLGHQQHYERDHHGGEQRHKA